jgi:hypothetical protein
VTPGHQRPRTAGTPDPDPIRNTPGVSVRVQFVGVVLLLLFFAVNALIAARTHTPTVDEFMHLPSGLYYLRTGDFAVNPQNPPLVRMLAALPLVFMDAKLETGPQWHTDPMSWGPWVLGTRFMRLNADRYFDLFFAGRVMIVLLGVAGGLLVFLWARQLYGATVGLGSLLLYCTMPVILGHASVVTPDVGVSSFLIGGFYALFRLAERKTWWRAAVAGSLFGLAFCAKSVTLLFLPLVPLLLALGWGWWDKKGAVRFALAAGVFTLFAWIAVNGVYFFSHFPFPQAAIDGIRYQAAVGVKGEYPSFLFGAWSLKGWWYYYLVALLYKVPLPFLLLLVLGILGISRSRLPWRNAAWIVLPPLLLLYILSFHYHINYGIRYLLPAFPFLILIAGCGIETLLQGNRSARVCLGALLLWQTISCVAVSPHHLAYFNELAGGTDHARRILLDSNVDWGQDLGRLKQYMDRQGLPEIRLAYFGHVDPNLYGIRYSFPPAKPEPGLYAISANYLGGYPYAITYWDSQILPVPPRLWSWLDDYKPVARVGHSIYIFDITRIK